MVEYLIKHGAKLDIPHEEGSTILHSACLEANLPMVELLLRYLLITTAPSCLQYQQWRKFKCC